MCQHRLISELIYANYTGVMTGKSRGERKASLIWVTCKEEEMKTANNVYHIVVRICITGRWRDGSPEATTEVAQRRRRKVSVSNKEERTFVRQAYLLVVSCLTGWLDGCPLWNLLGTSTGTLSVVLIIANRAPSPRLFKSTIKFHCDFVSIVLVTQSTLWLISIYHHTLYFFHKGYYSNHISPLTCPCGRLRTPCCSLQAKAVAAETLWSK